MFALDVRIEDENCNLRFIKKSQAGNNPERHVHHSWEILYIVSGSRTFFHRSETYSMNEGSIALIPPGVLHRGLNRNNEHCELINLYVLNQYDPLFSSSYHLFKAWADRYEPVIHFDEKNRYEIEALFAQIGTELTEKMPWYIETVWSLINSLILRTLRWAENQTIGHMHPKPVNTSVAYAMNWVNINFSKQIDLNAVAREIQLNPSYFSRLFYKETQVHFYEYLSYIRINHACGLLATTREPVYHIAERCGFGSITQFGRVFRKITGQHPLKYRKITNPAYKR